MSAWFPKHGEYVIADKGLTTELRGHVVGLTMAMERGGEVRELCLLSLDVPLVHGDIVIAIMVVHVSNVGPMS